MSFSVTEFTIGPKKITDKLVGHDMIDISDQRNDNNDYWGSYRNNRSHEIVVICPFVHDVEEEVPYTHEIFYHCEFQS